MGTRNEALLQGIVDDTPASEFPPPQSRTEAILTAMLDGTPSSELPPPQSRNEDLMLQVLDKINAGGVEVEALSVSANGTYTADTGKAYSPVTVDVEPNLESISVTENGTYTPDIGVDGFSSVEVNVSGGGDHEIEDALVERTLSAYTNSRVSAVGSYAFCSAQILTQVTFNNASVIGNSAFFFCLALLSATAPNCTSVGENAFGTCQNLEFASLPKCEYVGSYAFAGCRRLETVEITSCKTICSCAFSKCSSLTALSVSYCENIFHSAFNKCIKLVSLYLMSTSLVTLSHSDAFASTPIAGYTDYTGGVYGSIYVPASLLSDYKAANNWSYFSDRFVGVQ